MGFYGEPSMDGNQFSRSRHDLKFNRKLLMLAVYAGCVLSAMAYGRVLESVSVDHPFKIDGDLSERAYISALWSDGFTVLEQESREVNALYLAVDEKFVKTASRIGAFNDREKLYFCVRSNFPGDCPPNSSDVLEFHLRPGKGSVFCISVNVDGKVSANVRDLNSGTDRPMDTKALEAFVKRSDKRFIAEISIPFSWFGNGVCPKGAWTCNFVRKGVSCGGMSSWAATNREQVSPELFGKLVFGKSDDDESRQPLAENVGRNVFVWGGSPWMDGTQKVAPPLHKKELKTVRMRGVRGARATGVFRVSNMTDRNALYNLSFSSANTNFCSGMRLREVGYIELRSGEEIADPVFDLPIGSVLRIPARSTAIVWMDVDCSKLDPGRCRGELTMTPGYSDFPYLKLAVSLRVGAADIRKLDFPVHYYYNLPAAGCAPLIRDYGFNTFVLQPHVHFPEAGYIKGRTGREVCGFDKIDQAIERLLTHGMEKDKIRFMLYGLWPKWAKVGFDRTDGKSLEFLSPEWKERYALRVKAAVEYLRTRHGIGYDRLYFSTCDEPRGAIDDPKSTAYAAIKGAEYIRTVDPKLRLTCNPLFVDLENIGLFIKSFDRLVPYIRKQMDGQDDRAKMELYRDSGRWISSYVVYVKQNTIHQYRRGHWANLDYGFDGPCAIYGLTACAGDQFNSYDLNKKGTSKGDYNAGFYNARTDQITPSRRLEAWYQGLIDFKIGKWCAQRIAEAKKRGTDVSAIEEELRRLYRSANVPNCDLQAKSDRLFEIAEEITKENFK